MTSRAVLSAHWLCCAAPGGLLSGPQQFMQQRMGALVTTMTGGTMHALFNISNSYGELAAAEQLQAQQQLRSDNSSSSNNSSSTVAATATVSQQQLSSRRRSNS
jgi:hypothetical protein